MIYSFCSFNVYSHSFLIMTFLLSLSLKNPYGELSLKYCIVLYCIGDILIIPLELNQELGRYEAHLIDKAMTLDPHGIK